jgi:hypothetical protein
MSTLRRRAAPLFGSQGRHGARLFARRLRRRLGDVIEAMTFSDRRLGKRSPCAPSRMQFVALLPLFLWVSTPADAGIQTCHGRTLRECRIVKVHAPRVFPNPYSAWPNPFTVKPNPYGAWPNPFTVKPNPYGAWPNPFTVKPNPYGAWPNPFTAKPNPHGAWPNPFTVEPTRT